MEESIQRMRKFVDKYCAVPEENRKLFILQKENGSWKIDRYMFNKMK